MGMAGQGANVGIAESSSARVHTHYAYVQHRSHRGWSQTHASSTIHWLPSLPCHLIYIQEYAMAGQGANGMSAEFSVHTVEQAMELVASEELANGTQAGRGPSAGLWPGYRQLHTHRS